MRNIACVLLITIEFCIPVVVAETNVTLNLRQRRTLKTQQKIYDGTNSCVKGRLKKNAKQLEKEARDAVVRARYDERVKLWNEKHNGITITNKFEFWGFVFGSTYAETFPNERVNLEKQWQGNALVSRMVDLKEKRLGFNHACIDFTPCTLKLDNINFYWGVGKQASAQDVNDKIDHICNRLISEYNLSIREKKYRENFEEVRLTKGPVECDIFYTQGVIYLVVSHKDIKFGGQEQRFIGFIGINDVCRAWEPKNIVPQTEISNEMAYSLDVLQQDLQYYKRKKTLQLNGLTPDFDGIGGVVLGHKWIKNSKSVARGYASIYDSKYASYRYHLEERHGLFETYEVTVAAESHVAYAVTIRSKQIDESKQPQAIKDFDAIIGFLEDVCRVKFPRDYLTSYHLNGESAGLCDFSVKLGDAFVRADLKKEKGGLVYEIVFEREDIAEANK